MIYDIVVIGGGPAGLSAAIYAARFNLKTLVIAKEYGGLMLEAHKVENYPGYKSISGFDLMEKFKEHVRYFNVEMVEDEAGSIKKNKKIFEIKTKKKKYQSKTVVLAVGTKTRKLNIPGEEKYLGNGISYCAICLPPEESVILNSSIKKISKVTPLSRVLTMDGTYQDIEGFTKMDYSGDLISIKPRFFCEPVLLTPNHPVLTVKRDNWSYYKKNFKFTKPKWVEAGCLTTEYAVLYPIIKEVEDVKKIKLSDYVNVEVFNGIAKPKRSTHTSNSIPNEIKINSDFLRLIGYYLAEGCVCKHILQFTFNKNEYEYINDVISILKKIFKLNPNKERRNNVCIITIYSKPITDLFRKFFGKYAHNKQIPHWIMLLPVSKQKELIKGMWRGDGCIRDEDFNYVTSSRQLAYQLRDLLLRQKIIASLQVRKVGSLNKYKNEIRGRRIYFRHNRYHISIGGQNLEKMSNILGVKHSLINDRKSVKRHAWIHNNFAVLPIREIKRLDYFGKVLNISVKANNTYVAKNFIVHNCDAAFYKNKTVGVVGGSDTAGQAALIISKYAKKVYIIYRKEKVRAEPITIKQIGEAKNIEIINNTNVVEIKGNKTIEKVIFDNGKEFKLDGLFIEIGHVPSTLLAQELGVKLNEKNEIIVDEESKTNVEGVYAAGDIVNRTFKQAVTAASQGVLAAFSAYKYIQNEKNKV